MAQETTWLLQTARLGISMNIIWSLIVIACMDSQSCVKQDIQWFEEKYQCVAMKALHEELPVDGDWKTIDYKCTIVGAKEA